LRYFFTLLASAVAAYLLSFILTISANPEIRAWQQVNQRRDAELAETRAQEPNRPVILQSSRKAAAFPHSISHSRPPQGRVTCFIRRWNAPAPTIFW
jgi:hypothetical protein